MQYPVVKTDYSQIDVSLGAVALLVEDNPSDVMFIHEALREHGMGHQLFVARDGDEAIKLLDQIDEFILPCPELIILDINLPKRTGFEVLSRVRASPRCASKPVAILTSSGSQRDRAEAIRLGATAYFVKPGDLDEILAMGGELKKLLGAE